MNITANGLITVLGTLYFVANLSDEDKEQAKKLTAGSLVTLMPSNQTFALNAGIKFGRGKSVLFPISTNDLFSIFTDMADKIDSLNDVIENMEDNL